MSARPTPHLSDATANEVHDLTYASQDYLRRIHWWVRLFGIIWIVVPAVAAVAGFVFLLLGTFS